MTILAIECTGLVSGVALVDESRTIAEFSVNFKMTHSQTLMPMVEEMTSFLGYDLANIDHIACSAGPGSFTGLRIGAAAAKGLAMGLNKKIIPVPTLDSMAYNIFGSDKIIVPIMDARRGQVYTALYGFSPDLDRLTGYLAIPIAEIIELCKAEVRKSGKQAIFLGDGVPVFKEQILAEGFGLAVPSMNMQRAASVGALALSLTETAVEPDFFKLFYARESQAEREKQEKAQAEASQEKSNQA